MKADSVDTQFEFEQTSSGFRYRLPTRDLGVLAKAGWILLIMGIAGSLFMIMWMAMPAISGFQMLQQGQLFGLALLLFASFGLVGFRYSAMMAAGGYTAIRNRLQCEVEIKKGYLYSTELIGWFRFRRYIKLVKIKHLALTTAPDKDVQDSGFGRLFKDMAAIVAATKDAPISSSTSKPEGLVVAPGYPKPLLEALAKDLAVQLNRELAHVELPRMRDAKAPEASIAVVDAQADESFREPLKQPKSSKIVVAQVDETLAFQIPKLGFGKQSGCLLLFGVVWSIIPIAGIISAVFGAEMDGPVWFIFPLFLLIGAGVIVVAINMSVTSEMIGIASGLLFIEKKSLFGTKWNEFRTCDITKIVMGPSGMTVNDQPVMELQIYDKWTKNKTGLLSRLEDDELQWLAQELTLALGLTEETESEVQLENAFQSENWPAPPNQSRIDWKAMGGRNNQWIVRAKGLKLFGTTTVLAFFGLNSIGAGISLFVWDGDLVFCFILTIIVPLILIACAIISYMFATRGYEIETTDDQLTLKTTGAFATPNETISLDLIGSIKVVESGWEVNGKKVKQLAVTTNDGNTSTTMFGCEGAELAYIRAHLLDWARLNQQEPNGPSKLN